MISPRNRSLILPLVLLLVFVGAKASAQGLSLGDKGYLEKRGVNVMVYSNPFSAIFYDEKRSGIDIVHHGELTVTNGGVRLNETPEQWDLVPEMESRDVDPATGEISVKLYFKEYELRPTIKVAPKGEGFTVKVFLDKSLSPDIVGKACFNLEFLPSAYWKHSYIADGEVDYFPRYPGFDTSLRPLSDKAAQVNGLITADLRGRDEFPVVEPLARARTFVLAPDEPTRLVKVSSDTEIQLYDGRIIAQNGWFVLHSFLPADKTGEVLQWYVEPYSVPHWVRPEVIGFSQVGYTPSRRKEAILEIDPEDTPAPVLNVYKVGADGTRTLAKAAPLQKWGRYLRYDYYKADFSDITEKGIYLLEYRGRTTNVFPIADNVYDKVWYPTLDVWFPEQMDHMQVKEGYRVWHGAPHLDDVVQAPVDVLHFDNFQMGSEYFSPYTAYQFIEGFDRGGWFDAGDFDIEGGSHASVVLEMATLWGEFRPGRDETMVDQENKYVNIHFPDGKADLPQQIEHGVLPLVTMVEKIGHACRGINHATLYQYNRLDEPGTITDNKHLTGDERWLFTYSNPGLEMQFCAALAAAARALVEQNPDLSARCLAASVKLWNDNVKDGKNTRATLSSAYQLYLATSDRKYLKGWKEEMLASLQPMTPPSGRRGTGNVPMMMGNIRLALQAVPIMDEQYRQSLRPAVQRLRAQLDEMSRQNPYGVNVYGGGWGSTGSIVNQGINAYYANKYFPDIVSVEDVFRSADFIYGCHPYHNLSLVAGVGVSPKNVIYGNNRADFSFIAGALVPGFLLLQPDYIENKDDWPFFWGQNEATIGGNASYMTFGYMLGTLTEK